MALRVFISTCSVAGRKRALSSALYVMAFNSAPLISKPGTIMSIAFEDKHIQLQLCREKDGFNLFVF